LLLAAVGPFAAIKQMATVAVASFATIWPFSAIELMSTVELGHLSNHCISVV